MTIARKKGWETEIPLSNKVSLYDNVQKDIIMNLINIVISGDMVGNGVGVLSYYICIVSILNESIFLYYLILLDYIYDYFVSFLGKRK